LKTGNQEIPVDCACKQRSGFGVAPVLSHQNVLFGDFSFFSATGPKLKHKPIFRRNGHFFRDNLKNAIIIIDFNFLTLAFGIFFFIIFFGIGPLSLP